MARHKRMPLVDARELVHGAASQMLTNMVEDGDPSPEHRAAIQDLGDALDTVAQAPDEFGALLLSRRQTETLIAAMRRYILDHREVTTGPCRNMLDLEKHLVRFRRQQGWLP